MDQVAVFRGNAPAKIDDKARLKIPTGFRGVLETQFGRDLFVTSLTGESVRIYPMPVWVEIERKLAQIPSTHPSRVRFFSRVNYYGQTAELDNQGRVLIQAPLKQDAGIDGEVTVLGYGNYLHVQNAESIRKDVAQSIEADLETLSQLWRND